MIYLFIYFSTALTFQKKHSAFRDDPYIIFLSQVIAVYTCEPNVLTFNSLKCYNCELLILSSLLIFHYYYYY